MRVPVAPRIVVASDSFKGSLSSERIYRIVSEEAARLAPGASCVGVPMADGGEGTLDAVAAAVPGCEVAEAGVHGPLGAPRRARFGLLPGGADGTCGVDGAGGRRALIEMAEASGLTLVGEAGRDPLRASSYGTGELVRAALDAGCRDITLAVGGSATNDGGAGMLRALGVRLLDGEGRGLDGSGASLGRIRSIDASGLDGRLTGCSVTVMGDVDNPLLGPEGATRTFGPQKGADAAALEELESGMATYARVVAEAVGLDFSGVPGAGAAGGLAFAALAFLGARLVPGAERMLDLAGFDGLLDGGVAGRAALCITGEGHLDAQTAHGKAVSAVAARCRQAGVPCVAIVGGADADAETDALGLADVLMTAPAGMPLPDAIAHAEPFYRAAADQALSRFLPR